MPATWRPSESNGLTEGTLHFVHTRRCLLGEAITVVALTDAVLAHSSTTGGASRSDFAFSARYINTRISTRTGACTASARFRAWPLPIDNIAATAKTHQRQATQSETTSIPLPIRKQPSRQLPTTRTTFAPTHGTPPSRRHHKSLGHHGRREYNGQGDSAARTTLSGAEHSNTARRRFHDTQRGEHAWLWV